VDHSSSRRPFQSGPANDTSSEFRPAAADAASLTRAHLRAQARAPKHRLNRKMLGHSLQFIDAALCIIIAVAGGLMFSAGPIELSLAGDFLPLAVFMLLAPKLLQISGVYKIIPGASPVYRILTAFIALGFTGAAVVLIAHLTSPANVSLIANFAIAAVASLTLVHMIYAGFIQHWSNAGRLVRNIVLVGATANARKLIAANAGSKAVNVVGVFDDRKSRSPSQLAGAPYLGDTDDLFSWPMLPETDRIVLTVTQKAEGRVQNLLSKLRALPQPVCLLLDLDGFDPGATSLENVVGVPAARMSGIEDRLGHLLSKRLQDIVFGTILLIAALPVMAVIAVGIRLDSPGPILFRQQREGFNGRLISVLKFRSMRHREEATEKAVRQVEFDDPRVTRLGRFLRRSSLDELPQFWNVLMGDMSLVGPRPHAPSMKTGGTETSKLVAEYAHRHRVKPGITGWAQVNGSRGPLHTPEAARERIRWDVDYISRAGFWFDFWIMLRTLPALLGDKINIR
jgi:Undecaprenyl-phosphate glucose phosphotransferase